MSKYIYAHVDDMTKGKVKVLSLIKGTSQGKLVKQVIDEYLEKEISSIGPDKFEVFKDEIGDKINKKVKYDENIFGDIHDIDSI
jgi:hypothetical protein